MSIGSDPEVFILDEKGSPVPAWKHLPDKAHAKPGPAYVNGHRVGKGSYYRDGYAAEFNTTPGECRAIQSDEMGTMFNMLLDELPVGYSLTTKTTIEVDRSTLVDVPSDCQIFGCDPSIDAYTGTSQAPNVDPMTYPYRHIGAHMHTSWPLDYKTGLPPSKEDKLLAVRMFDLFLGLPDAYMHDTDDERLRRRIYGRAGECRLPEYDGVKLERRERVGYVEVDYKVPGIEYRTPCAKLWNDHRLAGLMFGVMRSVLYNFGDIKKQWQPEWEPEIQRQINECNVDPKWLQVMPGYYTPEILKSIKDNNTFGQFAMPAWAERWKNRQGADAHEGYGEWAERTHGYASLRHDAILRLQAP